MSEHSIHVSILGRVQAVGYRAFVEDEALLAGVGGWVRNRRDGSVEAMFSGDVDTIRKLIEVCRRGPSSARVDAIHEREATPDEIALRRPGDLFSVLSTV